MSAQYITPFLFEGERMVRVLDRGGAPWFVAKDVCSALGITWKGSDSTGPLSEMGEDERGISSIETPGGLQEMVVVSESGVYVLIFRSRKPQAVRFRKWVTGEVLPAIRKTGGYSADGATMMVSPAERDFPHWPLAEMRAKKDVVEMYRMVWGVRSAQWISPQVGFPVPPPSMIDVGRQADLFRDIHPSDDDLLDHDGGAH